MFRRFACIALCLGLATLSAAQAGDPVADARKVISEQISAFLADDSEAAYALASPGMRGGVPDEKEFLDMVRERYAPVYRATKYAFGRSKLVGGGELVLQEVMIGAREGADWLAIYEMRLMDDGSYKVNGVRILRDGTSRGI
ncbi:hypothetical protein REJC140_02696 [Pseudorhizobium endolithicum]|uniref:DUF4864 domain-containing protein n=1 Tax=Pseudorhizobium endolithicum TaxID=1191678 RepID=A0ABN7JG62_9HYPH|nr:DUF4864 domain-containing protein [Pseudorhizobium endolithicum]CAD7029287.1 hypothetical protein REJC140_02696 [Pseudorhizobium endolithicum]